MQYIYYFSKNVLSTAQRLNEKGKFQNTPVSTHTHTESKLKHSQLLLRFVCVTVLNTLNQAPIQPDSGSQLMHKIL